MLVQIPAGEGLVWAELPERTVVASGEPRVRLPAVDDLEGAIRGALARPLDRPPLGELVGPGARVTIAFDDPTVLTLAPVRRWAILAALDELTAAGVDRDQVRLLCANALHRQFRPAELARWLGDDLVAEFGPRLTCHDAEDPAQLLDLGQTPGGYHVELNRAVAESDLLVYVNAGYNRGFCGGWKSVCVGLSTYRSIRHHHTPDGMSMSLVDNRMHQMLDEMGRLVEARWPGRVFKLETASTGPFQVAGVFAGSVDATRRAAVELLAPAFPPRRTLDSQPYDVIVYGVPDFSPYAIGASLNPLLTLVSTGLGYLGGTIPALGRPGCSVILATPCRETWDDVHHPSYRDVWENVLPSSRNPWEIAARWGEHYARHPAYIEAYRQRYAFHPVHAILATYPLARLRLAGQVFVAGAENPAVPEHLGFVATATVEEAVARAEKLHGPDCRIAYVPQPVVPTKLLL